MNFQNTFKGRRVLVTGDTGFKGSWLCEWLLAEGAEVYGLGLAPNTEPSLFEQLDLANRIHHTELDIRDASALRKYIAKIDPEIILHLAAQPLVRLSYDIPVETYATNVMGTVHLLDAIRHLQLNSRTRTENSNSSLLKPVAVVMITTDKCYENKEWLHSYREEDPMGGHDPYSSSKGACEIAIYSFRSSYFPPSKLVNTSRTRTENSNCHRIAVASSLVRFFHAVAANRELQISGSYLMDFVFEWALLMKSFKISGRIALAQSSLRSSLIRS